MAWYSIYTGVHEKISTACQGLSLNQHSDRACCFLNLVSGKILKELYSIYKQDLFMIFPTFPKTN
jgi:hypothetical protein